MLCCFIHSHARPHLTSCCFCNGSMSRGATVNPVGGQSNHNLVWISALLVLYGSTSTRCLVCSPPALDFKQGTLKHCQTELTCFKRCLFGFPSFSLPTRNKHFVQGSNSGQERYSSQIHIAALDSLVAPSLNRHLAPILRRVASWPTSQAKVIRGFDSRRSAPGDASSDW